MSKDTFFVLLFWVAVIAFFVHRLSQPKPTPIPNIYVAPTEALYNSEDSVTQSYYYCWDTGNPAPHHLGHRVYGDHLCTNRELGR